MPLSKNKRKRECPDIIHSRPAKRPGTTARNSVRCEPAAYSTKNRLSSHATYKLDLPRAKLQVYVCGTGTGGELGLGRKAGIEVNTPRPNPYLSSIVNVATGGMHAVALTTHGKILSWGVNDQGTLGRDTTWEGGLRDLDMNDSSSEEEELNPKEATPTEIPKAQFPAGTTFVQVTAGDSTTFALSSGGLVYGCGTFRDQNGVFGFTLDPRTGERIKTQRTLIPIPRLSRITQIRAGYDFALALDVEGTVYAWGCGQQNELGHRLLERQRERALLPSPVRIPRGIKIVSIHTGANHAFAIDSNGQTWAWGLNNFGQTGVGARAGSDSSAISVQKVPALAEKKMTMISGGLHHSIGVDEGGECLVWGRVDSGQSGLEISKLAQDDPENLILDVHGRPRILLRPTALPLPRIASVAAGSDHCLAVTEKNKVYSWGFNATYQCGQGHDRDVVETKVMDGKWIREEKIVWAGAGGQYSMLASA